MQFYISVLIERRLHRFKIIRTYLDDTHEIFRVIAKNKDLYFRSNRPLFRNKGLKHRRIDWEMLNGEMNNMSVRKLICEAIERVVDGSN